MIGPCFNLWVEKETICFAIFGGNISEQSEPAKPFQSHYLVSLKHEVLLVTSFESHFYVIKHSKTREAKRYANIPVYSIFSIWQFQSR